MLAGVTKAAWLLLLLGMGCGGNTAASKPEPAAAAAGASSAGGTSSTPEPSNQSGDGPGEPLTCNGPQPTCLQSCASLDRAAADCVGIQYRCPEGWVDLDSCPKDACARRSQNCCSPTGHVTFPDCAADGSIGDCPEGFVQKGTCLPEGVDIQACSEIKGGEACASEELICYTSKCGRNCSCWADDEGVLSWQCTALPC